MTNDVPQDDRPPLPDDLLDHAADQLLGIADDARDAVLGGLVREHPEHAAALRALATDLAGTERLLADTYPEPWTERVTDVGGHRIVRRLGEGAFGIVYLCAQEQPVARDVAVKVLRPGAGDACTLRRFAAERQLLASLNHPAITQVFDAGALPDGRPFFVMEYVDGLPIRGYCDERRLGCLQRLRLFVDVCRGVAHAHGRGIVHRDLKPANVLVVETESGAVPKIIDFGIAKALSAKPVDDGSRTDAGRVIGTPGYMSPEQAAGRTDDIDERADVFALGVMLYELLTGDLPWTAGVAGTDNEPVRPSLRVTTATGGTVAGGRRRQLAATLRGDLDWITCKALAREREDRYADASALAADVERHLRGKPVLAGPPSVVYRLRKFVRRHRTAVSSAACAAVLATAAVVGAIFYANAERASASAAFADAIAVVERLLERANEDRMREAPRGDAARQGLLQDALASFESFLGSRPDEPALRAGRSRALASLSHVHASLGELGTARTAAEEAVRDATDLLEAEPGNLEYRALLADALRREAAALALAGDHAVAQPKFVAAVGHLERCAARRPERYAFSHAAALREAATTLPETMAEERLAGFRASFAVLQRLRATGEVATLLPTELVQSGADLADQLADMREYDEAKNLLTQLEPELENVVTGRLRLINQIVSLQARVAWDTGERATALPYFERAVESATAWVREQPQRARPADRLVGALRQLAFAQNYVGEFEESKANFRRSIAQAEDIVRRFPGDPTRAVDLSVALHEFARTLFDGFRRRDLPEAIACAERALEVDAEVASNVAAGRPARWMLLTTAAGVAQANGEGLQIATWHEIERELRATTVNPGMREQDILVEAWTWIARAHFQHGEVAAAAEAVGRARTVLAENAPHLAKRMVEVGWLEAQLAVEHGDVAEAVAAADRVVAARPTWFGRRRAADCLHLASGAVSDATSAAELRGRAAEMYAAVLEKLRPDVEAYPDDPYFVLPFGFASIRLAEIEAARGARDEARDRVDDALERLSTVEADAHADQWEADVVAAGRALQLALGGRRPGR